MGVEGGVEQESKKMTNKVQTEKARMKREDLPIEKNTPAVA